MQTTITYNIPDVQLPTIIEMLGYDASSGIAKELFMNEAIKSAIIPAITDVFINIKQKEVSKISSAIPQETRATVESMISITTV